jgi:nucleoside 2-deoxyribosyltransferase
MQKFYFCGSIRGGRELAPFYAQIINILQRQGTVLTEHLGDDRELLARDSILSDREIHDRDLQWIRDSDMVIAEVSVPSLGVGYEVARAIHLGKPVLCLFNKGSGKKLSAMIAGCGEVEICRYRQLDELQNRLSAFIIQHSNDIKL